jgi:hypothetical protein
MWKSSDVECQQLKYVIRKYMAHTRSQKPLLVFCRYMNYRLRKYTYSVSQYEFRLFNSVSSHSLFYKNILAFGFPSCIRLFKESYARNYHS